MPKPTPPLHLPLPAARAARPTKPGLAQKKASGALPTNVTLRSVKADAADEKMAPPSPADAWGVGEGALLI